MDMDTDGQGAAELVAAVAAAVPRKAVSADVLQAIVREIPQLEEDKPLLALLASSVESNVETCLQIMQHRIDLSAVQAPAAAVEYARRLAQRGTPLTTLLRTYRLGHARFSDWLLKELALHADDAQVISATTLSMSRIVAAYIDQTSEEMVAAYTQEREHWLRNQNAARAARIRRLLSGDRSDLRAAEATLGYRLRQYHVGLVCWVDASGTADELTKLERAVGQVAVQAACAGDPVFLPRDESSAWAWLPLGIRDRVRLGGSQHGRRERRRSLRLRRPCEGPWRVLPHLPAGHGRRVGRARRGISRTSGTDVYRGGARRDDARIRGPAARLGAQHARGPGCR